MKRFALFLFSVCLLIVALAAAVSTSSSDKPKPDGKTLIEAAEDKADIFALPSFGLKANLRIENLGKMLQGSYSLSWNGQDKWREEISVPGYTEIQVGGKDVVYRERNTDFLPVRIDQLHLALGFGTGGSPRSTFVRMGPTPNETVKKVHDRNERGLKLSCVEIEAAFLDRLKATRDVCVDQSTGTLVRQGSFVDGSPEPIGAKMFPRSLSYVEDGRPLVEIQITEIQASQPFQESTFEPPAGSISKPGCMNPVPAYILKQIPPKYPDQERASRTEGKVLMYALLGADGVPQQLRVVSGVSPRLNGASVNAVQQWRYAPPTCSGHAVEAETIVTITYKMS